MTNTNIPTSPDVSPRPIKGSGLSQERMQSRAALRRALVGGKSYIHTNFEATATQPESEDEPNKDWKVTDAPPSTFKEGLYTLNVGDEHIGHEKERRRIEEARRFVHEVVLVGNDPEEQAPGVLGQGLELFKHLFPDPNEREPNALVRERLGDQAQRRGPKGCFDVIYGLEKDRNVVGIHHFSTIPLKGSDKAITYLQYTGSADDKFMQDNYGKAFGYRGHGIMTLLYAAMAKQAEENAKNTLDRPGGHAGTILESEFIGQASDEDAIRYTKERLVTHGRTGAKTIMLRMKDGKLISPHLQPALSSDAKAIKLLLSYRPAKYDAGKLDQVEQMDFDEGKRVVNAFIDNFDTEGFNKDEVEKARQQVAEWFANTASVELWPPAQLPTVVELAKQDPFLMSQCEDDFGDMDAHAALVSEAFGQKTDAAASVLGS